MKTTIEQIKVSDIPDGLQKNGFSSDEIVRVSVETVMLNGHKFHLNSL
jgi:hypothetical protein